MKDLTTIEACFKATGRDPKALPIVSHLSEKDAKNVIDDYNTVVVIEAINKGKLHEWGKGNWNYFLYPDVIADKSRPSGFRLSFYDITDANANAFVGARLSFRGRDEAKHFFDNFYELVERHYLGK